MHVDRHFIVTGGAGFIGSHLVDRLLLDGARVTVVDDCSTGSRENLAGARTHPNLEFIESAVSEVADLQLRIAACDAVYHLAAAVGVEHVIKCPLSVVHTNIGELDVVLSAAAAARVPVVYTSSCEVYGRRIGGVFHEDDDLRVGNPGVLRWNYAASKLMGECMAHAYEAEFGLPVVIVRLFNTVGPRQTGAYGMVLPRFIRDALDGAPLRVFGDGRQRRTFCAVEDTVEALVRVVHAPGETLNIGGPADIAILDLARLVIDTLGSVSPIELVPYDDAYGPGFEDLPYGVPSLDRLERVTGFRPRTSLVTVIARIAAAMRARHAPAAPAEFAG